MSGSYRAPRLTLAVGDRDHSQGAQDAPLVLVEYGDYQCPYCGAAYPQVKRVQKELGTSLRFIFRNFPITNAHPQAEWAAETAEAAAAQGRFWEVHDFLFENQQFLGNPSYFSAYESKIKLDARKITEEIERHSFLPRIKEDFESGVRSGVNGTPTFFINGTRYDGAPEAAPIVAALKRAGKGSRESGER